MSKEDEDETHLTNKEETTMSQQCVHCHFLKIITFCFIEDWRLKKTN